jgi:predicted thioesterase
MSMGKLQPGQSAEMEAEVTREMTVNRMGREGADVLSTPALLMLMEEVSIKASEPYLPEGHTTVGYAVDGLRHLAPTPVGGTVRVRCELTQVDRNRLTYTIEAFEGDTRIGVATHKRAVISTDPEA